MPYPKYKEIETPLLLLIHKSGGELTANASYEPLAIHFNLHQEEKDQLLNDGTNRPSWHIRVQWARNTLVKQGYLYKESESKRGLWKLTPAGEAHALQLRDKARIPANWLRVHWRTGPELIDLNDLNEIIATDGANFELKLPTYEAGLDGEICHYMPSLVSWQKSRAGDLDQFSLHYGDKGQYDDGTPGEGVLGTATYTLKAGAWSCVWDFESDNGEEDIPECELLSTEPERKLKQVSQWSRDPNFRGKVLRADNFACVITGESIPQVLDAAHVHEVRSGGVDDIYNGITLRKDLHALFDSRLFGFTTNGNIVVSNKLTGPYASMLYGKILARSTLLRIRAYLEKRNNAVPAILNDED